VLVCSGEILLVEEESQTFSKVRGLSLHTKTAILKMFSAALGTSIFPKLVHTLMNPTS